MILEAGNNLLIVHRRLFEKDHPRFFVGKVVCYDAGVARVSGYTFGRDNISQNIVRKSDQRTKLVGVSTGALIIYCLPDEISIESVAFNTGEAGLELNAAPDYSLNLSEWIHSH